MKDLSAIPLIRIPVQIFVAVILSLLLWAAIRFFPLAIVSFASGYVVTDTPTMWPLDYAVLPLAIAVAFAVTFAPMWCERTFPSFFPRR